MKLPLPPWSLYCVAALVILGAGTSLFATVVIPMIEERGAANKAGKAKSDERAAEALVKNERVENERIQVRQYQEEFSQIPKTVQDLFDTHNLDWLGVGLRNSDSCSLIKRNGPGSNHTAVQDWIVDGSIQVEPSPGGLEEMRESWLGYPTRNDGHLDPEQQLISFHLERSVPIPTCQGRCLDPHPGPFQTWNGQQNGCWVQVWRKWPEGCQHYQWYNTCTRYWDSLPNGAAHIYWTCCVH